MRSMHRYRPIVCTILAGLAYWGGGLPSALGSDDAVSIRMVPELTFTGLVGSSNLIQYVDALKNTNDWKDLATVVLKSTSYSFYDTTVAAAQGRFYRVVALGGGSFTNQPANGPKNMVWLGPGSFTMGSPESDPDRSDFEMPQFKATLTYGFWIGPKEVTQAEYQEVTGANPSAFNEDLTRPVDSVSWEDANQYCALLNERERKAGTLPAGYTYRLPTEAEWEYAARAGKATRFSFGDDLDYQTLGDYAWTSENSDNETHPTGQKKANAWGLFDLYGNVGEWCLDRFTFYTETPKTNPRVVGSEAGDRVFRGGSWADTSSSARAAARGGLGQASRLSSFGFRVVLAPSSW